MMLNRLIFNIDFDECSAVLMVFGMILIRIIFFILLSFLNSHLFTKLSLFGLTQFIDKSMLIPFEPLPR